jgi:DNA polymerase-3 subunit alpha (Gram-positive type)
MTDHGVVQSYPDGMKASSNNEKIKVIYGVEGYLVDDSAKITYDCDSVDYNSTFVVFDLETTGLNSQPSMGKMDRIIEIGAVKIIDGKLEEKFSSFVACPERLSKEIVELTGIHDYDLVGAPEIEKVIADFYKFTDGAYLVGHNVNFDFNFVRYYGEQNRYTFEHKKYDTLAFAQELLAGLIPNYKLNSVADYYGFTFNHHRAFDDALVTAKCFIELMKKRGKLPY